MAKPNFKNRTLFHGDNLDFLRGMNSETVHLIATDPPFNKNKDFHAAPDSLAAGAAFQDRWSWIDDIHDNWLIQIQQDEPEVWSVITAAKMAYGYDMAAYLCWLGVRLLEMRRVLRQDGAIYLHCDSTASHYIKTLMDAVFGLEHFLNEIIWQRAAGRAKGNQYVPRTYGTDTDSIFYYAKSKKHRFKGVYVPLDAQELKEKFPLKDERGWYNTDVPLFSQPSMGARPNLCYEYKGVRNPHPSGWRVSKEKLAEMDARGEIIWREGKRPLRKSYAENYKGKPLGALWTDIPNVTSGRERTGYPTQKPVALYERIIKASSSPDDVVLDPFCGCATTPIAAERQGRQWAGIDIWAGAYQMVLNRLDDEGLALPADKIQPGQHVLTFNHIHYETIPPARTDQGETAVLILQTPTRRVSKRYPRPRTQHGKLLTDIGAYCQGCGNSYGFDPRVLEVDHIRPKADGGSDAYDNLTLLCPPCNREKRDRYTLSYLQQRNRKNGWLKPENEQYIRHGKTSRKNRKARRRR